MASGTLNLDEVDLTLHPLKSELNFPVGDWTPLQPQPERWDLAVALLSVVLAAATTVQSAASVRRASAAGRRSGHGGTPLATPRSAGVGDADIVARLVALLQRGVSSCHIQSVPHLVLLSKPFYKAEIMPVLATWMVRHLARRHKLETRDGSEMGEAASVDDVTTYLLRGSSAPSDVAERITKAFTPVTMQLLNLGHGWLGTYLPHCLSKISRVAFGLLSDAEVRSAPPEASKSRALTAVPFVGKDVPTPASEFAHSEVRERGG